MCECKLGKKTRMNLENVCMWGQCCGTAGKGVTRGTDISSGLQFETWLLHFPCRPLRMHLETQQDGPRIWVLHPCSRLRSSSGLLVWAWPSPD